MSFQEQQTRKDIANLKDIDLLQLTIDTLKIQALDPRNQTDIILENIRARLLIAQDTLDKISSPQVIDIQPSLMIEEKKTNPLLIPAIIIGAILLL